MLTDEEQKLYDTIELVVKSAPKGWPLDRSELIVSPTTLRTMEQIHTKMVGMTVVSSFRGVPIRAIGTDNRIILKIRDVASTY